MHYATQKRGVRSIDLHPAFVCCCVLCSKNAYNVETYLLRKEINPERLITKCDHTMPANDEVTYSLDLENTGAVTFDGTGLTTTTTTES